VKKKKKKLTFSTDDVEREVNEVRSTLMFNYGKRHIKKETLLSFTSIIKDPENISSEEKEKEKSKKRQNESNESEAKNQFTPKISMNKSDIMLSPLVPELQDNNFLLTPTGQITPANNTLSSQSTFQMQQNSIQMLLPQSPNENNSQLK